MGRPALKSLAASLATSILVACQPSVSSLKATGPEDARAYIRIPAEYLDQDFVRSTGFIRDHKRDDVFAFGYIEREALQGLPDHVFDEVVELDYEAWKHKNFDPKSLEVLDEGDEVSSAAFE